MRLIAKGVIIAGALIVLAVVTLKGAAILIPSGTWVPQTNLSSARANASAALLQDGRVLIAGGDSGSGPVATADFFAADGTISAAPPMVNARSKHVAVTLQDGCVLVAGGVTAGGSATSTAEIYDPAANSWTSVGTGMTEARSSATAALLPDGRVIIAGGQNGSSISSTIEIFDPIAGSFSSAGTMSSPRTQHAMAVLHDGRVIITGGFNGTSPVASTDIFDPVAGTISAGPSLAVARFGHSATTLLNGQVVVIGGNNGNADPAQMDLASAELFDPAAGTFTTLAANMATPREGHLAILLPNNNNVLIVGGMSGGTTIAAAELFVPQESSQGAWTYGFGSTGSISMARSNAAGSANQVTAPSSVMQRNGVLMIAGGNDANGNPLNSTEAYGYATIQTDQGDYPPGTTVTITGSGWKPGETVTLTLVESPLIDAHGPFTTVADASGNISDSSFVTDAYDASILFTLTAAGQTSGFQAQTTFTDSSHIQSVVVGAQSPISISPAGSASYPISFTSNGSGSDSVTLSVTSALPTGASASFSPNPVDASSTSTLTITTTGSTPPGMYTFTVKAVADATVTSTGSLIVHGAASQYLVKSSNNSPTAGAPVTITAQLADSGGNPVPTSGKIVTWSKTGSGGSFGSPTSTTNANGVATVTFTSGPTVTTYTVTATDNTAPTNLTGTSGNITTVAGTASQLLFQQQPTNTVAGVVIAPAITVNEEDANGNVLTGDSSTSITIAILNNPGGGTLSGTTSQKVSNGIATFNDLSINNAGTGYTLQAKHGTLTSATSSPFNITPATVATTLTLNSVSPNSVPFGSTGPITFTATLTRNDTSAGVVGATINFTVDGVAAGSATTAAGGVAAFTTYNPSALSVATHNVGASFTAATISGTSFLSNTSGTLPLTVNKADTSSTVSSSANPSVFGQSVMFTATVSPVAPGTGTPAGTVQFVVDGSNFGTPVALAGGTATSGATATLAVTGSPHTVAANYVNSDGNFNNSMGSLASGQTVNPAPTSTSVSSSVNPSTFGQSVTFTATVMNTAGAGISTATPTGAVQFVVDGSNFGSPVAVSGSGATATATSQATATLTVNGGTPHTVTANYVNSDGNFKSTNGALTGGQTVNPAPTSTSVSSSANPSTFGQSVTFTATVTNTAGASVSTATPTGAVQFVVDGVNFGTPVAVSGSGATATATSQATATLTVNGGTAHTVTANYVNSDGNFSNTTGSLAGGQTVNPAPTSTSVSSSVNPSTFGQSVTFTATVTNTAGAGVSTATPTGAVQFVVDGVNFGTPVAVSGPGATATATSQATATLTVNGGTPHTVTANYVNSDGNFSNTTGSLAGGQTVNPAPTSTSVSSSANPSVFGQSVTFTATVMNTAGAGISTATPTGSVQFVVDGSNFGSPVALVAGSATSGAISTLTVSGSPHTVTANYVNSDGNFSNSMGSLAGGQTVNPAPTSTSVSSSANPSVFGQSVTFTATVMNTAGAGISTATPTGSVQFVVDGSNFGSPVALVAGSATSGAISTLTVSGSPHTVTANYVNSDGNFSNSMGSLAGGQTVNPAPTSTSVSSSANPSVFGQSVTFTATVMNTAGAGISTATPTGSVQFVVDGSNFGSPVALVAGSATSGAISTLTVSGSPHTVTANYVNSDGNFSNSMGSLAGGQTVKPAPTSTSVSSSANPSVFGQSVTFTATVMNTAGAGISTATPTGSVQFVVDGSNFGSPVALVAGSATSGAISTLTVSGSPHTVTANYVNSDGNFSNSMGSLAGGQTVNPAPTSTSVSSSANPSTYGQSVTFTATVMNTAGAGVSTATPTGSVQFVVDGSNFGSPVSVAGSGGTATATSMSTSTLSPGAHNVVAAYTNSDGNFVGSTSSTFKEQVNYGFLGLQSPYMPPPTTFNVKRTMPLKWQYTNSSGAVVNSASASPAVVIQGPYACGEANSAGDITVNDAGASGYQYDSITNTWQFNWQIKGNMPGCYDIFIKSQQSGQTNGAFPISVVNQ